MPLLINAVSKITQNGVKTFKPSHDIIYNCLGGKKVIQRPAVVSYRKQFSVVPIIKMTTEQKRKYLMQKYVRQYT